MTDTIYELAPKFDGRKSFYGKARVTQEDEFEVLHSYRTTVAIFNPATKEARVSGVYSATTLRHIKEFLRQRGLKAETQKQILTDYCHR